jgi:hypothetical protein
MAVLLDQITIGSAVISVLDSDPSTGAGYSSEISSISLVPSLGKIYWKSGALDTDWSEMASTASITEAAQDAVASALQNSSDITFNYNDASNQIEALLTASGASAGTYGSASATVSVTVDAKGRITSISTTPISVTASQVSDFNSAAEAALADELAGKSNVGHTHVAADITDFNSAAELALNTYRATVQTTDATPTTIISTPVPLNSIIYVKAFIVGLDTTNRGMVYERSASFKNVGGTVTQIGNTQSDFTQEQSGVTQANVTVDGSGSNAIVQVSGIAATTINWHSTIQVVSL